MTGIIAWNDAADRAMHNTIIAILVIMGSLLLLGCEMDTITTGMNDVGEALNTQPGESSGASANVGTASSPRSGGASGAAAPSTPAGVPGAYLDRVAAVAAANGKSAEWEEWMIDNYSRYSRTFAASRARPSVITISYRYYDGTPPARYPTWASEAEHMTAFGAPARAAYPGYNFNFVFNGNTGSSYANVIAGIPNNMSYSYGKDVYLYHEGIFNHEFGHTMGLPHHYDSMATVGDGQHMATGDGGGCIMDRNSSEFCSACRTSLGLPL